MMSYSRLALYPGVSGYEANSRHSQLLYVEECLKELVYVTLHNSVSERPQHIADASHTVRLQLWQLFLN